MKLFDTIGGYILVVLIIFACLILIFATSTIIIYCGAALIVSIIFLSIDFYYRRSNIEIHHDIINNLNKLINILLDKK